MRPRHNLPPESQPWARSLEIDIDQFQLAARIAVQETINAFKALNSTMKRLQTTNISLQETSTRLQETNVLAASTQSVPYDTGGIQYQSTKPAWANYALCTSGAALVSKTINGDVRIVLMHSATPITGFMDYKSTLDIGVGVAAGDFVPQSFPFLVDMTGQNVLYTRPWSVILGATSGSVTATFTTNVQWLQL